MSRLRNAWYWLTARIAAYYEARMGLDYTMAEENEPDAGPWTIRYTTADRTWRQGFYADLDMAQMNARLAGHAGMAAEVEPL